MTAKKKDEVKVELPKTYKEQSFAPPTEEWDPLEASTDDEPEEEPCETCLEEATEGSFVEDTEAIKAKEEQLKQELGVKQAEHTYQVVVDAKKINIGILIARRLGGIAHSLRTANRINQAYYELVKGRTTTSDGKPKNPYIEDGIYKKFEEHRHLLIFDENKEEYIIRPRQFLGAEIWNKVMAIVRNLGGSWESKGKGDKNAYWSVPK